MLAPCTPCMYVLSNNPMSSVENSLARPCSKPSTNSLVVIIAAWRTQSPAHCLPGRPADPRFSSVMHDAPQYLEVNHERCQNIGGYHNNKFVTQITPQFEGSVTLYCLLNRFENQLFLFSPIPGRPSFGGETSFLRTDPGPRPPSFCGTGGPL